MNAIIDELFPVVQAHGMPMKWKSAEEHRKHFYTSLIPPTSKHFPSMYHDVMACKQLEIDALDGSIVKLAREKGICVPVNETITCLLMARRR